MQIHPDLRFALEQIAFIQRFKKITERYSFNLEERFDNFSSDEVISIINEFGYKAKFIKGENFFKITEKIYTFQFQFNISLKHGVIEFIWDVLKAKERLYFGWGSWGSVSDILDESEKLKNPIFRNYEDLREILTDAFSIYEDFKKVLIQQETPV